MSQKTAREILEGILETWPDASSVNMSIMIISNRQFIQAVIDEFAEVECFIKPNVYPITPDYRIKVKDLRKLK